MIKSTTLLVALSDPAMTSVLRQSLPELEISEIASSQPLPSVVDPNLWCFIEWLLPDISGLEVCRRVRSTPATSHAQIVMIMDDLDGDSRRRALKAGADDYVLGPLTPQLIAERFGSAVDRAPHDPGSSDLRHGALGLDCAAYRVSFDGRPIPLQPKQFALLAHFMKHPNRVHARGKLIEILANGDGSVDERTVDAWVARLRRALRSHGAPDPLRTVRDHGYVFDAI